MIRLIRESDGAAVLANPDETLGTGHAVRVVAVDGDPALAAKLYARPGEMLERRIRAMLASPPAPSTGGAGGGPRLAWPVDVLREEEGRFAGVLMPRVSGAHPLSALRDPELRRAAFPSADYALAHRAAAGLAAAFDALHAAGHVAGSIDEADVLVDAEGRVTLAGLDAVRVADAATGEVLAGAPDVPELSPPELHAGRDLPRRTAEQDRFTLAVLVFQLLMEGAHPFAGDYAGPGEAPSIAARVAGGMYPYLPGSPFRRPPQAPPLDALAPAVRDLVSRCFVAGHRAPSARPTAAEWVDALSATERALLSCAANARHRYGPHLAACPWCEMARITGRDPWTSGAAASAARPQTPRPAGVAGARSRPVITEIPGAPRKPAPVAKKSGGTTGRGLKIPASTGFGPLGETGTWLAGFGAAALVGFAAGSPRVFLVLAACLVFGLAVRLMDRSAGGSLALMVGALAVAITGLAWSGHRPGAAEAGSAYPAEPEVFDIGSEADARSHLTFEPSALDSMPVVLKPRELSAAFAPLRGLADSAFVSFVVDASGGVDTVGVRFANADPPGAHAMKVALARGTFFKPGYRHGSAVRTRVDVWLWNTPAGVAPRLATGSWNEKAHPSTPAEDDMHTRLMISDSAIAIAPPTPSSRVVASMAVQKQPVLLQHEQLLRDLERVYPPSARKAGLQMVTVRMRLTAGGAVDPGSIDAVSQAPTPDTAFVRTAAGLFAHARFKPAYVEGKPASVWAAVSVMATP